MTGLFSLWLSDNGTSLSRWPSAASAVVATAGLATANCCPGLQSRKEDGEFWVFSLLLPCTQVCLLEKPSLLAVFCLVATPKNKGHPIVELNCYTQKTVVDIPYVLINLCLSWAHQNGLDCECLHGAVWTSFLILCFPFIRIVGRNNTWSFSKQLILHVINKGSEKNTHCNHLPPLLLAVILVSELHTKIVILEEGGGMSELCLDIWQFFSRDAPMLSSLLSHFIWQSDSFPLKCARV